MARSQMEESQAKNVLAGNLSVSILATIAVALRLLARRVQKITLGYDDYLILLALPLGWGMCVATICAVHFGLGKHLNTLGPSQIINESKAYFFTEICWVVAICLMKISILLFYVRIFGRLRYMRYLAYGIGAFTICWAISTFLVLFFQCRPIEFIWNKGVNGTCIQLFLFLIIGSAINSLVDFAILLMPIHPTWNLHMPKAQRISIIGIFSLGSLTCIIGLIRLASIVQVKNSGGADLTWTSGKITIWSTAEPCLGILAGCLMTMRPLLVRAIAKCSKFTPSSYSAWVKSRPRTNACSSGHSHGPSAKEARNFQRLPGFETDHATSTHIFSGRDVELSQKQSVQTIPLHAIKVETRTSWENETNPSGTQSNNSG